MYSGFHEQFFLELSPRAPVPDDGTKEAMIENLCSVLTRNPAAVALNTHFRRQELFYRFLFPNLSEDARRLLSKSPDDIPEPIMRILTAVQLEICEGIAEGIFEEP